MPEASETHQIRPNLNRIELEMPGDLPEPASEPRNVYLLAGEAPALINAGHPQQFEALSKAIRSLGVELVDIARILHTSWAVASLGGAKNFPETDHFVLSPDMVEPRDYQRIVDGRRRNLMEFGDELLEHEEFADQDRGDLESFAEKYFPALPRQLDFVPIRSGHVVRVGEYALEVIATPGPESGHACFFDADEDLLFTGDFSIDGMPTHLDDVQSYFVSLERLIELDASTVLPNSGEPRDRGTWALQGAHRFINNFMSHAPQAMYEEPTLVEFARRDWGGQPDDFAQVVLEMRVYRALMQELVRSRMVEAKGEGLDRRFGTDFDDPREDLRDF